MKFDKVIKGYDPDQVDQYLQATEHKNQLLLANQKQRIDELSDENFSLRKQLDRYRQEESSIAQTLLETQKFAQEMKGNAEKFSDMVLTRAKIFYATWVAYSQTFIATLSDSEVKQFNQLKRKVEQLIEAYDGQDLHQFAADVNTILRGTEVAATTAQSPAKKTVNPIRKVEQAASVHAIDLAELVRPTESLEELCKDLGLKSDID